MKTNTPSFLIALFFIPILLVGSFNVLYAQTAWDIEREKQHGVLRLKIEGLTLDDYYYFVYRDPETGRMDTLRNFEMHVDLGNTDSAYRYNMGPIMRAVPPHLYGKGDVFIYRDWYYVSFPILGLDSAQVFAVDPKSQERMRIFFAFNPSDTADYAFQFNFQSGDFFVPAEDLRKYALSLQWSEFDYRYDESNPFASRYSGLKRIAVHPSQTSNKWLSIIEIESIEPFRFFRFFDRPRLISAYGNVLNYRRHPYFKKYKHTADPKGFQRLYPPYLTPDTSSMTLNPYCVENIFVQPVYLYSEEDASYRPKVNRSWTMSGGDTAFLKLEEMIESILFTQQINCNAPFYLITEVDFPFRTDSLVSLLITKRYLPLPAKDFFAMKSFDNELKTVYEENSTNPKLKHFYSLPVLPQTGYGNFPFDRFGVEIPSFCDHPSENASQNYLDNGYTRWKPIDSCTFTADTSWGHSEYISMVLNPYTLQMYNPEELFGPDFRQVVYNELSAVHDALERSESEYSFNLYHYRPELKRHFMWGLEGESVVIYYGNEGEYGAYQRHYIPMGLFEK